MYPDDDKKDDNEIGKLHIATDGELAFGIGSGLTIDTDGDLGISIGGISIPLS